MPVQATVILDSGCLLPGDKSNPTTEVGYFQSSQSAWDIRIVADGNELVFDEMKNLGNNCKLEIRHVKADGSVNQEGARPSATFHDEVLHMRELYGVDVPVAPENFDCIICFDSGLFCGALLKPRRFKLHESIGNNELTPALNADAKMIDRPIAHNIHVHFKLEDGETIALARGGKVFWSSDQIKVAERLEIEIIADNTTAEKFYHQALKDSRNSYWLPNQGDPPPMCPSPPCKPPPPGDR
jgi:hypothetical protein